MTNELKFYLIMYYYNTYSVFKKNATEEALEELMNTNIDWNKWEKENKEQLTFIKNINNLLGDDDG